MPLPLPVPLPLPLQMPLHMPLQMPLQWRTAEQLDHIAIRDGVGVESVPWQALRLVFRLGGVEDDLVEYRLWVAGRAA